jgi:hypothetical protein
MSNTFRPSRLRLARLLVCAGFFTLIALLLTALAAECQGWVVATICGGAFSPVAAFCVWAFLDECRHRLVVDDERIRTTSLRRQSVSMDFAQVTEAIWSVSASRAYPSSLRLKDQAREITIRFNVYPHDQRRALVQLLRSLLPEGVQKDWHDFWYKCSDLAETDEHIRESIGFRVTKFRMLAFYAFNLSWMVALIAFSVASLPRTVAIILLAYGFLAPLMTILYLMISTARRGTTRTRALADAREQNRGN